MNRICSIPVDLRVALIRIAALLLTTCASVSVAQDLFEQHRKMMQEAINAGDVAKVRALGKTPYVIMDENNSRYLQLGFLAFNQGKGSLALITLLLDLGSNPNAAWGDHSEMSPLSAAALCNAVKGYDPELARQLIDLLLSQGADPSLGYSLSHAARLVVARDLQLSAEIRRRAYERVFLHLLGHDRLNKSDGAINRDDLRSAVVTTLYAAPPENAPLASSALQALIDHGCEVTEGRISPSFARTVDKARKPLLHTMALDSANFRFGDGTGARTWILDVLDRNASRLDFANKDLEGVSAMEWTYLSATRDGSKWCVFVVDPSDPRIGTLPAGWMQGKMAMREFLKKHGVSEHSGAWPATVGVYEVVPWMVKAK